jgi:dienelactone hydrolase
MEAWEDDMAKHTHSTTGCGASSKGAVPEAAAARKQDIPSATTARSLLDDRTSLVTVWEVRPCHLVFLLILIVASCAFGQSDPDQVGVVLGEEILPPNVALFQVREYLLSRASPLPVATTARQWSAEAQRLRRHLLKDVVFHGWPEEWVNAPPKFEDLGVIETHHGYRLRKLRYEIVPGFQSVGILYEPENLQGNTPAILNVNGHVGPRGTAVEYKQKRCINFAQHGILALNLEWFSFGELRREGNEHWYGAHLDLVGLNELGLFFLEMRRGLDYLYNHPKVDRNRLGVTGLSGGGWQTIVLSSLDERVKVAVPVAGYSALRSKLEARKYGDLGDIEQNGTDFLDGADYTDLTAMMAPRPTLLIYDAEDDCCFRGPLVKSLIFDEIKPFFRLYGKESVFEWYENRDPGTHNYHLYNREQTYRFFSQQFNMPVIESESPAGQEIKSYDELVVGLPKDNLTILDLARKLGGQITRPPLPADPSAKTAWVAAQRQKLRAVVRYKPVSLARVWTVANTKNKGLETKSYLFEMNNGLSANGVWLRGIVTPAKTPVTIVLNDKGKKGAGVEVSDRVNQDEQVLALDLMFMGDAWKDTEPYIYAQILGAVGDRPLGMEAAQLTEIAHWMRSLTGVPKVRVECAGIRSQVVTLVAAALEPDLFSQVVVHEGMPSLGFLLQAPVTFEEAPELFCLDLYKDFDLDCLAAMAAPTQVTVEKYVEIAKKK